MEHIHTTAISLWKKAQSGKLKCRTAVFQVVL